MNFSLWHLEELDFLLHQRQSLLADPEIGWMKLAPVEERLAAHLEAFRRSGQSATDAAFSILKQPTHPEIAGAFYALCETVDDHAIQSLREWLSDQESDRHDAIAPALRLLSPHSLSRLLHHWLTDQNWLSRALAVNHLGSRHLLSVEEIQRALDDDENEVRAAGLVAATSRPDKSFIQILRDICREEPSELTVAAAWNLILVGDATGREYLEYTLGESNQIAEHAARSLAMLGGVSRVDEWVLHQKEPSVSVVDVTGILGTPAATGWLLERLQTSSEALRIAAARSLERIHSSGITETYVRTEQWPLPQGGFETDETTASRPSTSYEEWSAWLSERERLQSDTGRLRLGTMWSQELLVDELQNPSSNYHHRTLALLEWQAVHLLPRPFEVDWKVAEQQALLTTFGQLLTKSG